MTRTRWRTLAGVLALSLGGFVVCANDKPKVLPAARQDGPCCPVACCPQCPCPVKCDEPCCPPTECPVQGEFTPVPCQLPAPVAVADPVVNIPDMPKTTESPVAVKPVAMTTTTTIASVPYRVRMEMIGGITQVELIRGDETALRIQCDRVDVQMPSGGIQAVGKVCVSAPGIDIRCNRMLIGWHAGEIAMEGQVRILCQNGQQRTEMSAESLNCRLNSVGTGLDFNSREAPKSVQD